jgi:hemolysin III
VARRAPTDPPQRKPVLRGASHALAFVASLAGASVLVHAATTGRGVAAGAVYGGSLVAMFGASALHHLPTWRPAPRRLLRRIEHATIFLLIAGTYAPLCLAVDPRRGLALLAFVATCAAFGVAQALIWPDAPRALAIAIYLALGWAVFPVVRSVHAAVGARGLGLLAVGGVFYSAGALVYWARRPDPAPAVFGYHELFHLAVVVAAACHYAALLPVVGALR